MARRRGTGASPARRPSSRPPAAPRRPAVRAPGPRPPATLRRLARDPRWILLPLRAYLAVTFLYAGLSKIAGRAFLDASSPTSMHATLLAVRGSSPIGGLLGPVADHSFAFGLAMALGETAVGIGLLLGLLTRVAALGGMLLSLSLFLTVSWNASPWYTGADIVYLFALTPLLLGGAGPVSADEWLAARAAEPGDEPLADRTRRTVLAGAAAVAGLLAVGAAGLVRRTRPRATQAAAGPIGATSPSATTVPTAGSSADPLRVGRSDLVAAARVPVGGATQATDPVTGDEIYVLQLQQGSFTALDSVCPHQGCTVAFLSAAAGFECPCHGSTFDSSGAVTRGPAASGLTPIPVHRSGSQIVRG